MNKNDSKLISAYKPINTELTQLENYLRKVTNSSIQIVSKIGNYMFREKGKRIRPALLILCSKLLGNNNKEIIRYASVMEFIHTASLIHDDIVDNSDLRRGKKTIHSKWGSNISVLLGDYLYILSIKLSLNNNNSKIIQTLSDIASQMIEGEILEFNENWNFNIKESLYFEIIRKKTASLFAGSCKMAAILAQANPSQESALVEFGLNAGLAFQIIDDLFDFTADEKILGKPVLSDLREGKITLPIIYLLKNKEKKEILKYIRKNIKDLEIDKIINMVKESGAIEYCRNKAKNYINKSKKCLENFSDSIYKKSLITLSEYIIERGK